MANECESDRLKAFDPTGDVTSVGPRWKRWKRSFQYYLTGRGIKDDDRKKALLLHLAGERVHDIFDGLAEPEVVEGLLLKCISTSYNRHLRLVQQDITISTKNQLFTFNGQLYQQIDGVAMGSPLGPLLANTFLRSIEEGLVRDNILPSTYRRYVDGTLAVMNNIDTANKFLDVLNDRHDSIAFTMEVQDNNNELPFLGMVLSVNNNKIGTRVYKKPTDTGLFTHYLSYVDNRYKKGLLFTMFNRAQRLSSTPELFDQESNRLTEVFSNLQYPLDLINRVRLSVQNTRSTTSSSNDDSKKTLRIPIPFKNQKSAEVVKTAAAYWSRKSDQSCFTTSFRK
ncbi:hypothetical protein AC249_AIPGENE305 [Exaiptasia diaphana]|nr:hypothetical protein AC249_AIPGENE305 [Exaiptasia diaphana]